ncbi:MAG: hypothetical protein GY903_32495 [Fuerstiella sp.]|nr:hypothetical protein [Fuerstiella sp.]MCP4859212.1 hypothetical protein [Fuerstiella sp.]
MNAISTDPENDVEATSKTRQQLLELARHLDRFGRDTEQFLNRQLDELGHAIDDFEREKAAWRRQLRRESRQLARQREEIEQLSTETSTQSTTGVHNTVSTRVQQKRNAADAAARKSGEAPVTLLLQRRDASPMQLGLLMFEVSKLNRDMGGRGLTFEVASVRTRRRSLLSRNVGTDSSEDILELTGFSTLPLAARGSHVTLDVDITDRIEDWIMFKSRLLQSSLGNGDLAAAFKKYSAVKHDGQSRSIISEANRRVDDAISHKHDHSGYSSTGLFSNTPIDSVQQQVLRLESCYERLLEDSGLRVHAVLNATP